MFVECFSGLMGGGKSFYSIIRAAEHVSKGGIVYSNIKIELDPWFNESYAETMPSFWLSDRFDGCRKELHQDLQITDVTRERGGIIEYQYNSKGFRHFLKTRYHWEYQFGQYSYLPDSHVNAELPHHLPRGDVLHPVLVILDEALDHFEANGTGSSSTAEFRSFLRHVRKLGINLIFIAQDFGSLEKKIRVLTHFVWRFRDLKTWPLPIINRPLPPPWCNNIIAQQFHSSQFGTAKAQTINFKTWIPRESLVFGCYQSVSIHNAQIKMADDVKTDFRGQGDIRRKKKMSFWDRVVIYGALILLGWCVWQIHKTEPVMSSHEVTEPVTSSHEVTEPEFLRPCFIEYSPDGRALVCYFEDGEKLIFSSPLYITNEPLFLRSGEWPFFRYEIVDEQSHFDYPQRGRFSIFS